MSGSWGMGSNGSQKKTNISISPSEIFAPICWSPPNGPLTNLSIGVSSRRSNRWPVVPVAINRCLASINRWAKAHSESVFFILSCATRAMLLILLSLAVFVCKLQSPVLTLFYGSGAFSTQIGSTGHLAWSCQMSDGKLAPGA